VRRPFAVAVAVAVALALASYETRAGKRPGLFVCTATADGAAEARAPALRVELARVLKKLGLHRVTDGPASLEPATARCDDAQARVKATGLSGADLLLQARFSGRGPDVRLRLYDAARPESKPRRAEALAREAGGAGAAVELAAVRLFIEELETREPGCRPGILLAGTACIPAGLYRLGFDELEFGTADRFANERQIPPEERKPLEQSNRQGSPARWVFLNTFLIDRYEVSCREYDRCIDAGACGRVSEYGRGRCTSPALPVVNIDWKDAAAYCAWVHRRLPSESEWEVAGRGSRQLLFPWGSVWEPEMANLGPDGGLVREEFRRRARQGAGMTVGGTFAQDRSPFGVMDLAGNVSEWVADRYQSEIDPRPGVYLPALSSRGDKRVVRGGNFVENPYFGILAVRRGWHEGVGGANFIGFRCVADPPRAVPGSAPAP